MKSIYLILLCIILYSCSEAEKNSNVISFQLPKKSKTDSLFPKKIRSIHLIKLEVDSTHYMTSDRFTKLYVGNKFMFFLTNKLFLSVYDKATGKKIIAKSIRGRSRNECISANSIYGLGDTLIINDQGSAMLKMYDCFGNYCGLLAKEVYGQYVFPYKSENSFICCNPTGHYYDKDYFMVLLDSSFSMIQKYFLIPEEYKYFGNIESSTSRIYMHNDTLRFMFPYSNHLYSYPETTYKFCITNTIPKKMQKEYRNDPRSFYNEISNKGYISDLVDFAETDKYFTFKYSIKKDEFCILANKHNTEVLSISAPNDIYDGKANSLELWRCLVYGSTILYCDSKYLYAKTILKNFRAMELHNECLDAKQRVLYEEMRNYINENKSAIDDYFNFFIKIELE